MSYPDQFTPHDVSKNRAIVVDSDSYDYSSLDDIYAMEYAAIEYDLLFGFGGIIYDAQKSSPN